MNHPVWEFPATIDEALSLRATHRDDALIVAGGTFVGVLMSSGLLSPHRFISLGGLAALRGVEADEEGLILGALATHADIAQDHTVRQGWSALADSFAAVASRRVRNRATVGGVLGDADYASDPPAMLAALSATVWLQSERGIRGVAVEDFILGHYTTAMLDDELITHVSVPASSATSSYWKFKSRSSEDRPCVGVAVSASIAEGHVEHLRVVVGAVCDRPVMLSEVCTRAEGLPLTQAASLVADGYADLVEPMSDQRGSAAYRKRILAVGIRRSLEAMVS